MLIFKIWKQWQLLTYPIILISKFSNNKPQKFWGLGWDWDFYLPGFWKQQSWEVEGLYVDPFVNPFRLLQQWGCSRVQYVFGGFAPSAMDCDDEASLLCLPFSFLLGRILKWSIWVKEPGEKQLRIGFWSSLKCLEGEKAHWGLFCKMVVLWSFWKMLWDILQNRLIRKDEVVELLKWLWMRSPYWMFKMLIALNILWYRKFTWSYGNMGVPIKNIQKISWWM